MGARRPGILFLVLALLLCVGTAVYGQTPATTSQAEIEQASPSSTSKTGMTPEVET
jgi:hypothetical protein